MGIILPHFQAIFTKKNFALPKLNSLNKMAHCRGRGISSYNPGKTGRSSELNVDVLESIHS